MIKKLQKHGNSLALVLEKPLLELLHVNADSELQIIVDGNNLVVSPVMPEIGEEEAIRMAEEFRSKHGDVLKALAE